MARFDLTDFEWIGDPALAAEQAAGRAIGSMIVGFNESIA